MLLGTLQGAFCAQKQVLAWGPYAREGKAPLPGNGLLRPEVLLIRGGVAGTGNWSAFPDSEKEKG